METHKFIGNLYKFDLNWGEHSYIMGNLPYGQLRNFIAPDYFNAQTGTGEQRIAVEKQKKKIELALKAGKYVSTIFAIGTREDHRQSIVFSGKGNRAELEVISDNPLPLIDANTRREVFEKVRKENPKVDELPIPFIMYLSGDTKEFFLALQEGLPVSKDHMLSMRMEANLLDAKIAPSMKIAVECGKLLHKDVNSPFHNLVQFVPKAKGLPLSINSLCGKNKSDSLYSLYGAATVAVHYKKTAQDLFDAIMEVYTLIRDETDLLEEGKILQPVPDGTVAGSTLLIALGNILLQKTALLRRAKIDKDDVNDLVEIAEEVLNVGKSGNTSNDAKRILLNEVCTRYFEDVILTKEELEESDTPSGKYGGHEGIPVVLINLLGPGAYKVSKLPTLSKKKGRKKAAKIADEDVIDVNEDMVVDSDEFGDNEGTVEGYVVTSREYTEEELTDDEEEGELVGADVHAPWDVIDED